MRQRSFDKLAKELGVSGLHLFRAGVLPRHTVEQAREILAKMGVIEPQASAKKSNVAGWDDLVRAGVAR